MRNLQQTEPIINISHKIDYEENPCNSAHLVQRSIAFLYDVQEGCTVPLEDGIRSFIYNARHFDAVSLVTDRGGRSAFHARTLLRLAATTRWRCLLA